MSDLNAIADKVQRECVCIMWRGNITGRVITCGACVFCRLAEKLRVMR